MAFALVHFTLGFVCTLAVLALLPGDRFRLVGAYLGGIWALLPDGYHVVDGRLGDRLRAIHDSSTADAFFWHHTLDSPAARAANTELTLLALAVLGTTVLAYDTGRALRASTT